MFSPFLICSRSIHKMRYFLAVAFLAAASALPLDFHPSLNFNHPSFSSENGDLRIVGGREVPPHEVPYQAGLYFGEVFCGGSLINEKYVLTSAQCASLSSRPVVILGAHRIKEKEKEQLSLVASKVIIHPHWERFVNDIALVMLPQRIRFTSAIRSIQLAPPNVGSFENEQARITGWGTTRDNDQDLSPVLQYIINPIVRNQVCENAFRIKMIDGQMCLSGEGRRSPCLGDGGAPVVSAYRNELVQVGIVSFMVENQCERGYPVGLTRISSYYNWIVSNM